MATSAVRLVRVAEYARHRGVSEGAVRRAVKESRITLIDGRIDPAVADVQWAANSRPRAGSAQLGARTPDAGAYATSRARREQAEAEMAEMKLAELRGTLCRVADIERALSVRCIACREILMNLRDRLAPVLAATSDVRLVHAMLGEEHARALQEMANRSPSEVADAAD